MNPPSLNPQLFNAVSAVAQAGDLLARRRERLDEIRREEKDALNAVNEAQSRLDEIVAEVKKGAPWGTGWNPCVPEPVRPAHEMQFEVSFDWPEPAFSFTWKNVPAWLTSDDLIPGAAVTYRVFFETRVLTLDVGQSVWLIPRTITRVA